MTGWVIQFDGKIFAGTPSGKMSKPQHFCGEAIADHNPDCCFEEEAWNRDFSIMKAVSEFFKIKAPYTISLRVWHPSNIPKYHFKKIWVNP
jgi:hypothetical protein